MQEKSFNSEMIDYQCKPRNIMFFDIIDLDIWCIRENVWSCNINNKLWCLWWL